MTDATSPPPDEHGSALGPTRRTLLAALGGAGVLGIASGVGSRADADPESASAPPLSSPLSGVLSGGADARRAGYGRPDHLTEARIDDLLARMTFAEKLGQLQLVSDADTAWAGLAADGGVGGVFDVTDATVLDELQRHAVTSTRLGIPLIFGLDVIHGYVTTFPIPLGQAASWDASVTASDAHVAAAEARASGLHWTFAPMMDVTREPRWGRIAEGYGEDPYLAAVFAAAKVAAYQGGDYSRPGTLAACAKHFVAYGGAEGGRDYNTVDVSVQRLHNLYLPPFLAAVRAGVATIMAAYNAISGVPAHGDRAMLRDTLKGRYDFDGFVVSDFGGVVELDAHGLTGSGADAAALALAAGVDMEMHSSTYGSHGAALYAEGRITAREIDDAVRRVLRVKFRLGLFEQPYTDPRRSVTSISGPHARAARDAAARSMVLLRNEQVQGRSALPLGPDVRTVALIGPLGRATADLNGTWPGLGPRSSPVTIEQGLLDAGFSVVQHDGCTIGGGEPPDFTAALDAARDADVAVLAVGESARMSGEASSRSILGLPGKQLRLVEAVAAVAPRTVVVLVNGRPLTLEEVLAVAPAVLEAWAPGCEGGHAIADVLTGAVNPGGKLPVTFPRSVGQVPIYYNHENTGRPANPARKHSSEYLDLPSGPQLPFGFGLSYTTFELSGLQVSSPHLPRDGAAVDVRVVVSNVGDRLGDEVVQLYVHDPVASIVQPVRRLRGFERVTLLAGTHTTVRFTLTPDDVGFYDNDARFVVEAGLVEVYVGTSSDDDQLRFDVTVT